MNAKLKKIIEEARQAGACKGGLEAVGSCDTVEEALALPQAPAWACWYAETVLKGRWPEVEAGT